VVVGMFLFLFLYIFYFFFFPKFFEFESETSLQKIGAGIGGVVFAYCTGLFAYYWYQLFKSVKGFFTFYCWKKIRKTKYKIACIDPKELVVDEFILIINFQFPYSEIPSIL
jgi:hypothetical protein